MTGQTPLGHGPGGKGYFPAAFEESKARAAERRMDREREGISDIDPRGRAVGQFLMVAALIAVMTYAIWQAMGPLGGVTAGILFTVGAFALWRFWR